MASADVIAAIATAPGRAGVGVIRVSGPSLEGFASRITGGIPPPRARQVRHVRFVDGQGEAIDEGLLIYFQGPASFTGEDVVELQGHGSDAALRLLLARCLELGARLAQPGEFTLRAYFNHKIDLAQAEAVADLIAAESTAAVRSAVRSLTGRFSQQVHALVERLVELRLRIEGCIDFADEAVDFLGQTDVAESLSRLVADVDGLTGRAAQGVLLRSGCHTVLIGAPNVGKSSLLNAIAEEDHALVTDIPGTTRDLIRASVFIEGVPFHMVDTAGIRETADVVEQAGIERTWQAVVQADLALVVADIRTGLTDADRHLLSRLPQGMPREVVFNKADLASPAQRGQAGSIVSATTGEGLSELKRHLLQMAGWNPGTEPVFMARERHRDALLQARRHLEAAGRQSEAFELLAEELRLAQNALSSITGEFSPDDLLGEIFSRFCIGK
ncbi:MAG: tRNA uridine-5-carboxymethylaminomethyl(34) synthesis GTPase MnmE [Betaproteobacteria bacterium]|nr:tRNA uridine-5-carboxymethylaminomethyl(34) synthesis GTPase MnmE [Betaproteobacteria bacterium]